jgi:hypothetical protein
MPGGYPGCKESLQVYDFFRDCIYLWQTINRLDYLVNRLIEDDIDSAAVVNGTFQ